ncbi:hypothetical protein DPEC_G00216740 [Dallia pectoralis]|uniref:Uncharacterized protein n=1 Tax=Dallia pectoralis TaxID=75939 RepID=A0ACC2G323_DALPE|nr:hypothetical protein DPEC_G00216740 [Dallia pectoralis]
MHTRQTRQELTLLSVNCVAGGHQHLLPSLRQADVQWGPTVLGSAPAENRQGDHTTSVCLPFPLTFSHSCSSHPSRHPPLSRYNLGNSSVLLDGGQEKTTTSIVSPAAV